MGNNIYLAINGDDVGSRIGDAIANDDHESLAQASSSIQNAHDSIDQWIDSIGGKKISGAGDDAIYLVPEQAVNDLDSIRESYKQESGHGLTVGVGPSMSQASKALIYGKLNDKNQTIHYEPSIEDYLSDEDEDQPEVPAEDDLQDQADSDIEADAGAADLDGGPAAEGSDEDPIEEPDVEDDGQNIDAQASEEMGDEPPAGNEDDMAEDDQTLTDAPADPVANATSKQKMAGNTPAIDGKTDVDSGTSEEDLDEDADVDDPAAMQGTDDNLPDTDEDIDEDTDEDIDADADPSMDDGSEPAELNEDDIVDPNAEEDQDADQEGFEDAPTEDDGEDSLASMIHGDMQDGGGDSDMTDPDEADADPSLDDELRQDIAEALISFKENKDMLEQAREQNPELYNATLTMMRSMIAMAKKLGFGPEQDMADKEAEQQLDQEFPEADAEDTGEEMGEDTTEDMPNEEEGEDAPIPVAGNATPPANKGLPPAKK